MLAAVAAVVGMLSILALAGGPAALALDDLQELAAAAGGAVALALASRRYGGHARRLLVTLAVALGGACLGMVAWDVADATGYPLSPVGNVLFVLSVAIGGVALVPAIFGGLGRPARVGVAIDTLILFLAGVSVVTAIGTGTDLTVSGRPASFGALLLAASTGACMFALIARRIAPTTGGPWVLVVGAAVLGTGWLMWVSDATAPSTVGLSDFLFSAGLLLIAYGGATWDTRSSSGTVFDRVAPVLTAALPISAILVSLGIAAATHGVALTDTVALVTGAVIVTSVGRQAHLYVREAQARDGERRAHASLETAHRSLEHSAAEIEDLYDHAPVGYHSLDADGRIVRINDTELSWLGLRREDVLGKIRFADLLHSPSREEFEAAFEVFKTNGAIHDVEYEVLRSDGSVLPVLASATAIRNDRGEFVRSRGTLWDITERRRAEQAIRAGNERFRILFEQATDPIAIVDRDNRIVDGNPALAALLGYSILEIRGMALGDNDGSRRRVCRQPRACAGRGGAPGRASAPPEGRQHRAGGGQRPAPRRRRHPDPHARPVRAPRGRGRAAAARDRRGPGRGRDPDDGPLGRDPVREPRLRAGDRLYRRGGRRQGARHALGRGAHARDPGAGRGGVRPRRGLGRHDQRSPPGRFRDRPQRHHLADPRHGWRAHRQRVRGSGPDQRARDGGTPPPGRQDGGRGQARRWRGPRLQQHPDGDPRLCGPRRAEPAPGIARCRRPGPARAGCGPGRDADAPAAGLRPQDDAGPRSSTQPPWSRASSRCCGASWASRSS
jgi:PAS domain S-box-containing protein